MTKPFFAIIILCVTTKLLAQKQVNVQFNHRINNGDLVLNDSTYLIKNDRINLETLKYYITNIELYNHEKLVWKEKESAHLIDEENPKTKHFVLTKVPQNRAFNTLKFDIGVDSLTNVSGAHGDDLDPTKGMYWTWQNGYINFKLEGKNPICNTPKHQFTFHIGGYKKPCYALQKVVLNVKKSDTIVISVNLNALLDPINFSKTNQIMLPDTAAFRQSLSLPKMFFIP